MDKRQASKVQHGGACRRRRVAHTGAHRAGKEEAWGAKTQPLRGPLGRWQGPLKGAAATQCWQPEDLGKLTPGAGRSSLFFFFLRSWKS